MNCECECECELDDAVYRVRTAIAEGVSEIWLSSEDTGAYGIDLGTDITRLLKDITAVLPTDGSCMLRLAGGLGVHVLSFFPLFFLFFLFFFHRATRVLALHLRGLLAPEVITCCCFFFFFSPVELVVNGFIQTNKRRRV